MAPANKWRTASAHASRCCGKGWGGGQGTESGGERLALIVNVLQVNRATSAAPPRRMSTPARAPPPCARATAGCRGTAPYPPRMTRWWAGGACRRWARRRHWSSSSGVRWKAAAWSQPTLPRSRPRTASVAWTASPEGRGRDGGVVTPGGVGVAARGEAGLGPRPPARCAVGLLVGPRDQRLTSTGAPSGETDVDRIDQARNAIRHRCTATEAKRAAALSHPLRRLTPALTVPSLNKRQRPWWRERGGGVIRMTYGMIPLLLPGGRHRASPADGEAVRHGTSPVNSPRSRHLSACGKDRKRALDLKNRFQ